MEEYEDERPPTGGSRPSSARPSAAREPITAITQSLIESRAQQPAEAIYELNLHNCGLQSMVGLAACTKLRMLDLSFNGLRAIEGLESPDLRELRLYGNAIAAIGGLERNAQLRTLLLHANALAGVAPVPDASPLGGDDDDPLAFWKSLQAQHRSEADKLTGGGADDGGGGGGGRRRRKK